jgi:hypothetical protein
VGRILVLLDIIEEYLRENNLEGLRGFLTEYRVRLLEEYRVRGIRLREAYSRSIKPISLNGDLACFSIKDLHWALSRGTLRRLGLK